MKPYRIVIGAGLVLGWIGVASSGTNGLAAEPINRAAGPVRLGMTVEEFQKAVKSIEQTGENPGLMQGERSFEVSRESLGPEFRAMGCRFLNGRLYRLTAEYRADYFDEARWDEWLKEKMERYGKVPVESKMLGERPFEFVQWDDPKTRMILQRELRMRFKSKKLVKQYRIVLILLDQALWKERQEAEGSLF